VSAGCVWLALFVASAGTVFGEDLLFALPLLLGKVDAARDKILPVLEGKRIVDALAAGLLVLSTHEWTILGDRGLAALLLAKALLERRYLLAGNFFATLQKWIGEVITRVGWHHGNGRRRGRGRTVWVGDTIDEATLCETLTPRHLAWFGTHGSVWARRRKPTKSLKHVCCLNIVAYLVWPSGQTLVEGFGPEHVRETLDV